MWTLLLLVARAEDSDGDGFDALPDGPDCDDDDPAVHPGARETCAVGDEDCDGFAQRAPPGAPSWRRDADGDGFGDDLGPELVACEPPPGWVLGGGDCADHDARRFPGATEACGDGLDHDCDGEAPVCAPPPLLADPGCGCAGVGEGGWSAALLGALATVGGRRRGGPPPWRRRAVPRGATTLTTPRTTPSGASARPPGTGTPPRTPAGSPPGR